MKQFYNLQARFYFDLAACYMLIHIPVVFIGERKLLILREHSAIRLTIKLPVAIKTFVCEFLGGGFRGVGWLSDRVLDLRLKGRWYKTERRRHCVVCLSKTLYPLHSTGYTQEDRKSSQHDL